MKIGKKKVAILGGAFDPIHLDHLHLSQQCLKYGCTDEVWMTPSPSKRWDKETHFSSEDRMRFIQAAIERVPKVYPCSLEVEWGEFRGAYLFLQKLQTLYPQVEFHLLMGADTYGGILQWRDPLAQLKGQTNGQFLIQEFPLILFARQGFEFPSIQAHKKRGGLPWQSLQLGDEIGDCSSTRVREKLMEGSSISDLVPESIVSLVEEAYRH